MVHTIEVDLYGRKIKLETGKMAKQANGAVVVSSGESVVLVTACANEEPKANASFFPLTVDYREYTYSAGRFPGGFIKREGRPSEKEILTSRMIDRPIRPLFPEAFSCETQVIGMVLSADVIKELLTKEVTLEMKVVATGTTKKGDLVFLNSAYDRTSDDNFTVVLDKAAQATLAKAGIALPRTHFEGKAIRVVGTLSLFSARPQIIVSDAAKISIVK